MKLERTIFHSPQKKTKKQSSTKYDGDSSGLRMNALEANSK